MSDYFRMYIRGSMITSILESSFCFHGAAAQQRVRQLKALLALKGGSLMTTTSSVTRGTLRSQLSGHCGLQGFPHIDQQVGRQSNVRSYVSE